MVVAASMIQCLATIASDFATMLQIVSIDMNSDAHMNEIGPLPGEPVPEAGAGDREDRAPADEEDQQACTLASSGRPPRRRRVPRGGEPMDFSGRGKNMPVAKPKPRPKSRPSVAGDNKKRSVLPKAIAHAPWRTKIARQRWLVKKNHEKSWPRTRSSTARASTWVADDDDEEVIDCEDMGEEAGTKDSGMAEEEAENEVPADVPSRENDTETHVEVEMDDEEWQELDEEYEEEGDGEGNGDEEYDETQLMQQDHQPNGKQLGMLDKVQMEEFGEMFKRHYSSMINPTIEKPVRMALIRGTKSKLPGIRKISKALLAHVSSLKLVESGNMTPPWWRTLWSRVRTAVRRAGKICHDIEGDETMLMQYMQRIPAFAEFKNGDRFWVARMLQKELELLQSLQKGIGVKIRQLLQRLQELEGQLHHGVRDLVDMLRAVAVSFQNDDIDESRPDEVDSWVEAWMGRIRKWIAMEMNNIDGVVVVEDSMEAAVEEGARIESAFVEMVVDLQKRLSKLAGEEEKNRMARSAAMAQQWDDWAVSNAMGQCHSPKRQRTVGTQVDDQAIAHAVAEVQQAEIDKEILPNERWQAQMRVQMTMTESRRKKMRS